jgi:hypothetical protein
MFCGRQQGRRSSIQPPKVALNGPACFSTFFALALLFQFGSFFRPADQYVADFLSFAIHHR